MLVTSSVPARIVKAVEAAGTNLIVGLDPVLDRLPEGVQRTAGGVLDFNRAIIEATGDLVAGYKLNFAFYEALGPDGWRILGETRKLVPPDRLAIGDAKRGDIGDTSEYYARAILDVMDFDAVTVTPYVGWEGLRPFLQRTEQVTFVVCRTSNRDGLVQDRRISEGGTIYESVASAVLGWGPNAGLVVGATDIEAIRRVRAITPAVPLLLPGLGAQGGDLEEAVATATAAGPACALCSASRSIIFASSGAEFGEAARSSAETMRTRLAAAIPTQSAGAIR